MLLFANVDNFGERPMTRNKQLLALLLGLGLLTFGLVPPVLADSPFKDSPSDDNNGGGNDPPDKSGQKAQPGQEGNSGP
jgi:hypothetical protein